MFSGMGIVKIMVNGMVRQTAALPSLSIILARAGEHGVSGFFVSSNTKTQFVVIKLLLGLPL